MSNVISKMFDKPQTNAYNTPDRKMRITDIIYGTGAA